MSESRKDVLLKALEAEVGGAPVTQALFTDDVVGWSPLQLGVGLTGLAALSAQCRRVLERRHHVPGLDEVGNKAIAEWLVEADHTGPLVLDEDAVLEATGRHVQLAGVTVADFP